MAIWRKGQSKVEGAGAEQAPEAVPVRVEEIAKVLAAPSWLRDAGFAAWLIVGLLVMLVGFVWLLSLTSTIVLPVVTAGIVAAVASPVIGWLNRKGVPRGAAAGLLMVVAIALVITLFVLILGSILGETDAIKQQLSGASSKIANSLDDLGIDPGQVDSSKAGAEESMSSAFQTLIHGVAKGVAGLTSLAVFLAFFALSLFFLLKDGPVIRGWVERQAGIPPELAHAISGRLLQSLRGYFVGVTAIALFNAVVVSAGAIALGVPEVGAIAIVTFVGAYIPYLGAWAAGAFAVVIALGGAGEEAAIGMIVIQLLANGILQQLVQPIAYGAALGIHPLAVLVVTIAGGCLFGTIGLVLAAPLTSAVVRIVADGAAARAAESNTGANGVSEPAPA